MSRRMVRKQFYITQDQEKRLKQLAKEKGTTEADLIRLALDRIVTDAERQADAEHAAAERFEAVVQQVLARVPPDAQSSGRSWKREDAYEERLGRYGRKAVPGQ